MYWKCCSRLIINCYYYITVNNNRYMREMQCVLCKGLN